jgi:arabinose-5-phosphate isomerase
MISRVKEILQQEIDALSSMPLDEQIIDQVINLLYNCKGKVIFMGMGKAGLVGTKIAASMSSMGTPSFFVHAGEMQHGDLGMIDDGDVVIALSNSGKTHEVLLSLELCKKTFSCSIIGITATKESELGKLCDLVLEIGKIKEACPFGLAPTCSTTAMMVLGDILTILLSEKKKFTLEDYGKRHHGGYLGSVIRNERKN